LYTRIYRKVPPTRVPGRLYREVYTHQATQGGYTGRHIGVNHTQRGPGRLQGGGLPHPEGSWEAKRRFYHTQRGPGRLKGRVLYTQRGPGRLKEEVLHTQRGPGRLKERGLPTQRGPGRLKKRGITPRGVLGG